ncbi:MAG: hypothetical protein RLT05_34205 [Bauldia litoralis]
MSDDQIESDPPKPSTGRRFPKFPLRVNWARLVIGAALLGGVWAIAHYVAISTMEGDCQGKVDTARAEFRKEAEQLSAQIAGIRAEVATKTALAERRGKANRELETKLRKAREEVAKAERALLEAEQNWKSYYDKMPEACRMKTRPSPRPGTEPDATTTPKPEPQATPSRVPLPTLRPKRP